MASSERKKNGIRFLNNQHDIFIVLTSPRFLFIDTHGITVLSLRFTVGHKCIYMILESHLSSQLSC